MDQTIQLEITSTMRTAAQGVALTHAHYLEHCHIMPKLKGKPEAMAVALTQRKEAHQAYHLALIFLKTATLKANPQFGVIPDAQLQERLNQWIDGQLNQLIHASAAPADTKDETQHIITMKPQELRWS